LQEVAEPKPGPPLELVGDGVWSVSFERPAVNRFEYRFELVRADGSRDTICDPANPLRAPGAFGERSVVEFPGYRPPAWLRAAVPEGVVSELELAAPLLGSDQPALLWAPHGSSADEVLPLLVVLDGIEFAGFSGLTRFLDVMVARRRVPALRALMLHPTMRNDHYSANPVFAEALECELLTCLARLTRVAKDPRGRAALGASLGGLALLHAHRSRPGLFGSLFLESASVFHGRALDWAHAERVERFVDAVVSRAAWPDPIAVELVCGRVEENFGNNRQVAGALRRQGYAARLHDTRDAHNWVAWRDAWTPHLVRLLRRQFS
jgi:enterochelin esterase-like enzyme